MEEKVNLNAEFKMEESKMEESKSKMEESKIEVPSGVNTLGNQEGTILVNRTWPPNQRQIKIQVKPFVTDVAKVSVGKGLTINAGNYNSIRVDVMVSLPCYIEEINETYQYAKQLAETWIKNESTYINEELKKINS